MAVAGSLTFNLNERNCVLCPTLTPSCPVCPAGTKCSISIQTCETCQFTSCIADPSQTTAPASSSASSNIGGPNVGAIAGGVIGGVLAIALLVYLVWRFCIKTKRQQYEQEDWVEFTEEPTPSEKDFTLRRDARASTHTVGSIASTVLTRASNIIQIAYIPGVTNRSAPSTPGLLVPPVPPIPIALSSPSSSQAYEDQHFFMPGDLRDSTYSGMTDRTSYAPRSSVASTIYGKNAVVSPVPAQTVIRGKAAVVSVKSNGASPGELTPPVPSVDYDKYRRGPPSPAFSVGSTFLNNASAATQIRPTVVRVPSGLKNSASQHGSDDDESHQSLVGRESTAITIIDDTPTMEQGPFSDPPERAPGHTKNGSLSAVIEEATKKAHGDVRAGLGLRREGTPFGDEHAMDD